jgi:hypothetical protein
VNLAAKLAGFSEHFSPKIVAELNNYKIEVVKAKGEFVWHTPGHRQLLPGAFGPFDDPVA